MCFYRIISKTIPYKVNCRGHVLCALNVGLFTGKMGFAFNFIFALISDGIFFLFFQYICENHFQRISNHSMFTGLKAINHFGRPDMTAFLRFVQMQHAYVSKVGVFSCGPTALTKTINTSVETVNTARKLPYFIHHYENF